MNWPKEALHAIGWMSETNLLIRSPSVDKQGHPFAFIGTTELEMLPRGDHPVAVWLNGRFFFFT